MPAALRVRAHWRASSAVGSKIAGVSRAVAPLAIGEGVDAEVDERRELHPLPGQLGGRGHGGQRGNGLRGGGGRHQEPDGERDGGIAPTHAAV